jgi:transposase
MARMYTTEGKGVKELAEIFMVSQRTVQRALKRAFSEASSREATEHE